MGKWGGEGKSERFTFQLQSITIYKEDSLFCVYFS